MTTATLSDNRYYLLHNFSNATTGLTAATESTSSDTFPLDNQQGVVFRLEATIQSTASQGCTLNVYRAFGVGATAFDTEPYGAISITSTGGQKKVTSELRPSAPGLYKVKVKNDDASVTISAYKVYAYPFFASRS